MLTDAQFVLYLDLERDASGHEAVIAAHGTLAAIGTALGVKGALKSFSKVVTGKGAKANDTPAFAKLRGRIGQVLKEPTP